MAPVESLRPVPLLPDDAIECVDAIDCNSVNGVAPDECRPPRVMCGFSSSSTLPRGMVAPVDDGGVRLRSVLRCRDMDGLPLVGIADDDVRDEERDETVGVADGGKLSATTSGKNG